MSDRLHTPQAGLTGATLNRQGLLTGITWEQLLLAIAVMGGTGLRFLQLDLWPLATGEAAYAWSAWRLAEGLDMDVRWSAANPLFLSLQATLFWLTGGSDFWARALDALAGSAALWVLYSWKPWLGRSTALLLVYLVAFTPWQIALARSGAGGAVAFLVGLWGLTLLLRIVSQTDGGYTSLGDPRETEEQGSTWESGQVHGLALIVGLLIVSGPVGWNFLVVGGIWVAIARKQFGGLIAGVRFAWRRAAVVGLAAATLGATGWLARPHGLGDVSTVLGAWLGQFGLASQAWLTAGPPNDGLWLVTRLTADQLLLTLVGSVGLAVAWRVRGRDTHFSGAALPLFSIWYGIGVLLLLAPGRNLDALAFFSLPCLVGAAWLLSQMVRVPLREIDTVEVISVGGTLAVLLASLWLWTVQLVAGAVVDVGTIQGLIAVLGLLVLLFVLFAYWSGRRAAAWMGGWVMIVLVLGGGVRATWHTSFLDPAWRPHGLSTTATHTNVRLLVRDLETISAQRTGDPHKMAIHLDAGLLQWNSQVGTTGMAGDFTLRATTDPVLAWYLRGFPSMTRPEQMAPRQAGDPIAIIIPQAGTSEAADATNGADVSAARGEGVYAESAYAVRSMWQPVWPGISDPAATVQDRVQVGWRTFARPLARWLLYREPLEAPAVQQVQVRLRLDGEP